MCIRDSVRPLLDFSKEDLLYVTKNTFNFHIDDPSNKSLEYLRSRVRFMINYLKKRNITGNTARLFGIGYSEDDFHNLSLALGENYTESNLIDAGLLVKKDKNSYDKFRDRIMFPIFHPTGKVIAFGGRVFDSDDSAKYLNSPETILYKKSNVFYFYSGLLSKLLDQSRQDLQDLLRLDS